MARAFVIRPFGTKTDSAGQAIDFERVQRELIDPALKRAGLDGGTTGEIVDAGNIRADMFALILEADLVVCDITMHNANVFYELGIRHALRRRRTVMIKGKPTADGTPFDLLTDRYLDYPIDTPSDAETRLTDTIVATLRSDRPTDSPVFQMLPSLREVDVSQLVVVPLDLVEEIGRARAARSKGWLRLLAEEVRGFRFQWEALRLVAAAQWDLGDHHGARDSWEAIRELHPRDVLANLALANVYERLSRKTPLRQGYDPEMLTLSDQALARVLDQRASISAKTRAEAVSLQARNEKTRWRGGFRGLDTLEARRGAATNARLRRASDLYQTAFEEDLNHFYPGLNALQTGTLLLDLARGEAWYDMFQSDAEGDAFRHRLEESNRALRAIVQVSIDAALKRMRADNPERVWAEISRADLLFLTTPAREERVIKAYEDAIPLQMPFAWDAARGQLDLFSELGFQAELAAKIVARIGPRFSHRPESRPLRLIVFAGHRVDAPDRPVPRFPPGDASEACAGGLIRDALTARRDATHDLVVLASAAPGADIIAHEVCADLGIRSVVCLPMPVDDFSRSVFEGQHAWRTRFLDLTRCHDLLILSDCEGLPRWLGVRGGDAWERGNRWVMKMAETAGADDVTLIALWDGKAEGDARGGTAHLVRLAERAGIVHVLRLDAAQLRAENRT